MSQAIPRAGNKHNDPKALTMEGHPPARQALVLEIEVLEQRIAPTTNLMDVCSKGHHVPTVDICI